MHFQVPVRQLNAIKDGQLTAILMTFKAFHQPKHCTSVSNAMRQDISIHKLKRAVIPSVADREVNRRIKAFQFQCKSAKSLPVHPYPCSQVRTQISRISFASREPEVCVHVIYILGLDWTVRLFSPAARTNQSTVHVSAMQGCTIFF